jgi:hypothetical protein
MIWTEKALAELFSFVVLGAAAKYRQTVFTNIHLALLGTSDSGRLNTPTCGQSASQRTKVDEKLTKVFGKLTQFISGYRGV